MRNRPDLSDAQTSVDWADRQIDVLTAELSAFAQAAPYALTTEPNEDGWTRIYITSAASVTKLFAPSVNAIIQAQRSSLDFLVVALAEANGANDPKDAYFPVVKTVEGLSEKHTLKKLRRLDPADQQAILDLKPYCGGNDTLFALHTLNLERKHRRLGMLVGSVTPAGFGGGPSGMRMTGIVFYDPGVLSKRPSLIALAQFEGDMQLQIATDITFCNVPGTQANPPVIATLHNFSSACRDIIKMFE